MKRGNLIAFLIICAVVGILIGYFIQKPKVTGITNSLSECNANLASQQSISNNYLNLLRAGEQACILNQPFSCDSWNIRTDKIVFNITNKGDKDYNFVTLRVENCGEIITNSLKAGETKTFEVPCTLVKKTIYKQLFVDFDGDTISGYLYNF